MGYYMVKSSFVAVVTFNVCLSKKISYQYFAVVFCPENILYVIT